MSLTRRRFIETASLSLLASAVLPAALASQKDQTFNSDGLALLDSVSTQTFEPYIGERFQVSGAYVSLILLSVTAAPGPSQATKPPMVGRLPKPSQQALTGFSLRFRGSGTSLKQGTYKLENPSLGSIPLFLVPSGPGVSPPRYTAVFNLLS
jgi:hypothetical protein